MQCIVIYNCKDVKYMRSYVRSTMTNVIMHAHYYTCIVTLNFKC